MGLDPDFIEYICDSSGILEPPIYDNIENLTAFEEALFINSGKKPLLRELDKQSLPLPPASQAEIGKLWNTKYNQIYCPMSANFIPAAYIEIKLLMSGQVGAFWALYGEDSNYKLNVNRLLKLNPYDSNEEAKWVTLADLLKHYIDNPVGQMTERQGLRERFATTYKAIINGLDAKHTSQLTPEEFEAAKAEAVASSSN